MPNRSLELRQGDRPALEPRQFKVISIQKSYLFFDRSRNMFVGAYLQKSIVSSSLTAKPI